MTPQTFVTTIVPTLPWVLLTTILGTIAAIACGVLIVQGHRIPAALSGLPVGIPALVCLGICSVSLAHAANVSNAEALRTAVAIAIGDRLLLPLFLGFPGAFALMLAAGGGALGKPRNCWSAAIAAVTVAAVVGCVIYAGIIIDDPLFTRVRAAFYLCGGVLVACAMLAGNAKDGTGSEAAGMAGVTFAMLVAAGETAGRALGELQAMMGLAGVEPALRPQVASAFAVEMLDPFVPWALAAVSACTVLVLVSVVLARHSVSRFAGAALGLVWCGLAFALLLVGAPSPVLLAAAAGAP